MNKIIKSLLLVFVMILAIKVKAEQITLTYSEWSTDYPSGVPERLIEEETRYHFYKIENGNVEYKNEYYTSLSGYTKDESSARTFYRYITNQNVVYDGNNRIILDTSYCEKHFCYVIRNQEPVMLSTDSKDINNYDLENAPVVQQPEVPFTMDSIMYYIIGLFVSISIIGLIFIAKKKQNKIIKA